MAEPTANLLVAEQVRKEFGGLTAVNDLDFTIPERSIVSLIGPNGAGKTTFFNMLTGVYRATGGASSSTASTSPTSRRMRSRSSVSGARSRTSASSRR